MSDAATSTPPGSVGARTASKMSQRQILVSFIGLMLVLLLASLDQTIVSTALYTILGDIGGRNGLSHMSWVVTAYLLTSTATMLLYGKISDLIGRKAVLMFAIVVFLVGSALCGLSQNMVELIIFRGLQGIGAGGLMSLTFAVIGDMVPPRERGKYQGYFGSVFALSTVAGPLIGGWFSDQQHLMGVTGWRWVFYVNVPIGIIALFVLSATMHLPRKRTHHNIDYVGAALMVIGICALLMVTEWGGQSYAWTSPTIIGLIVGSVVFLTAFVLWEIRAREPILPMHLFRGSIFTIANTIGFIIGLAMMGSLIYVSIYMQLVNRDTPTQAGLSLLPMMFGMLAASMISGQIISKIGRYKIFPILGTAVGIVGFYLMSLLNEHTSTLERSLYMVVVGVGIGLVMQVVVLAVQNSVSLSEMGIATSASSFFRTMGGAFGTAIFGSVLTTSLNSHITHALRALPHRGAGGMNISGTPNPIAIRQLPGPIQQIVTHSFVQAMSLVFVVATAIVALSFLLTWFLKEIELRTSQGAPATSRTEQAEVPAAHI